MNNFMNKLYVKALVTANMAKNELKKMCEEDEGMDIIVTIVLVALGIVIVGVVARIASDVIGKADQQVSGSKCGVGPALRGRTRFLRAVLPLGSGTA